MEHKRKLDLSYADLAALLALAAAVGLLIAKAPYGFGYYDESFYLATARRIAQGDAMIAQEWNLAQMFALFTAPLVALFETLNGGTDGIILAFRYLYVAVQGAASLFVYARLRKFGKLGAALAALSLCLFAPYNVGALSYNTFGILFMALAGVLLATMQTRTTMQTVVAGALYAGAVLCCPFLALGWVLLVVAALLLRRRTPPVFAFAARFTAGVAGLAAVFLGFVFTRTGPLLFLKGLRTMLQSTDRSSEAFGEGLLFCTPAAPLLFALFVVLYLAVWRDKRRADHAAWYLAAGCCLVLGFQLSFWLNGPYLNFFLFAINLIAPLALLCKPGAAGRRLLFCVWGPGLFYAFAISMASNQKFYALSAASSVATLATLVLLVRACGALRSKGKTPHTAALVLVVATLAVQLGSVVYWRWQGVFWQESPAQLTVQMTVGVQAGIYTDAELAADYTATLAATAPLRQLGAGDTAAFISRKSWLYLTTPARMGSFSSWLQLGDGIREKTKDQLTVYYDRYPEKLPSLLFVESDFDDVKELYCGWYGYTAQENELGWILSPPTGAAVAAE